MRIFVVLALSSLALAGCRFPGLYGDTNDYSDFNSELTDTDYIGPDDPVVPIAPDERASAHQVRGEYGHFGEKTVHPVGKVSHQVREDFARASHKTVYHSGQVSRQVKHDFVRMKERLAHEYGKATNQIVDVWNQRSIEAAREAMGEDKIAFNSYVATRMQVRNRPHHVGLPGVTNSAYAGTPALPVAPGPREVITINNLTLMHYHVIAGHIARYAQQCWRRDPEFSRYHFAGLESGTGGTMIINFVDKAGAPNLTLYANHGTVAMGYVISASGNYNYMHLVEKVHEVEYALKNRIDSCGRS